MRFRFLVLIALAFAAPTTARAAYIFDNLAANGGVADGGASVGNQGGEGATLTFSSDTTISDFDVLVGLGGPGQMRFVIFGSTWGTAPLFVSAARSYASDRLPGGDVVRSYKNSGAVNFTFLAGQTYNVGYLAEPLSFITTISRPLTQNGITAAATSGFFFQDDMSSTPRFIGGFPGQLVVRLSAAPGAVPEPSSLLGLSIGCGLVGLVARRRAGRSSSRVR